MSEETATKLRPYPAAIKDEIADLNMKMDSLIKHWADAAEMTTIMEACRATVQEAHQANYEALTNVNRQLGLLLTPVEIEAPPRGRLVLWSVVIAVALLLSFGLGTFVSWSRPDIRRLDAFLADVHTTLEHSYAQLPKGVQDQLQAVYRQHKYEPLRATPQEKRP